MGRPRSPRCTGQGGRPTRWRAYRRVRRLLADELGIEPGPAAARPGGPRSCARADVAPDRPPAGPARRRRPAPSSARGCRERAGPGDPVGRRGQATSAARGAGRGAPAGQRRRAGRGGQDPARDRGGPRADTGGRGLAGPAGRRSSRWTTHRSAGDRRDPAARRRRAGAGRAAGRRRRCCCSTPASTCSRPVGDLVTGLLGRAPELRVLATSQIPLGLDGEVLHAVAPLSLEDAVVLFAGRAARSRATARPDATTRTPRRSGRSAPRWTGCRWRSSWPPRGPSRCRCRTSTAGWTTASRCCAPRPGVGRSGAGRSPPRSAGATTCCSRTTSVGSGRSPASPGARRWPRLSTCSPRSTSRRPRSTWSTGWSTGRGVDHGPAAAAAGTGCWTASGCSRPSGCGRPGCWTPAQAAHAGWFAQEAGRCGPAHDLPAAPGLLGEPARVGGQRGVRRPGLAQPVERVRPDAVEQPVADAAGRVHVDADEAALGEAGDDVDGGPRGDVERGEHVLRGGERRPAAEAGERPEPALVVREEQVVAPADGGRERPTAVRGPARRVPEQHEAVVEPAADLLHRQRPDPGRGELDGERQAVQAAAHVLDGLRRRRVEHEPATQPGRAAGEERDRVLDGQRLQGVRLLAVEAERHLARREDDEAGRRVEQPGHEPGDLVDEVLAAVEEQGRRRLAEPARAIGSPPETCRVSATSRPTDDARSAASSRTSQTPPAGESDRATSSATRDLPTPAGPTTVTSRSPRRVPRARRGPGRGRRARSTARAGCRQRAAARAGRRAPGRCRPPRRQRRGARIRREVRALAQHLLLEQPQLGSGLQTQLVGEQPAHPRHTPRGRRPAGPTGRAR